MVPKRIDVVHPSIIQFNSGKLSFKILNTNGLRQHFVCLISIAVGSVSNASRVSDVTDFAEPTDNVRRRSILSKLKQIIVVIEMVLFFTFSIQSYWIIFIG
jgi:hypothetical protein